MTPSALSPSVAVRATVDVDADPYRADTAAQAGERDAMPVASPQRGPRPHRRTRPSASPRSRSTPAGAQIANRGPSAQTDPVTSPTPIAMNPLQAEANHRSASAAELTSLLSRYDTDKDGLAISSGNDAVNAELGARLAEVSMAGYPDDARRFEQDKQRDLGMLAQLPADTAAAYRNDINVNADNVGSTPNTWLRGLYEHDAELLRDQLETEYREVGADPLKRLQSVFNAPHGADMLNAPDEQQNLANLRELRKAFSNAHTKTDREKVFSSASQIRQSLQERVTDLTLGKITEQKRAEAANEKNVMQAFEEAATMTGPGATPGARLAYLANRIGADSGHARAFTELRSVTPERLQQLKETDKERFDQLGALKPERLQQLTQWENDLAQQDRDAARRLPEVRLDPPRYLSDVRLYVPAPGPDYGEHLRALYTTARDSINAASERIHIAQERPSSPIRQSYIRSHQLAG
jgi:hypothetical protein